MGYGAGRRLWAIVGACGRLWAIWAIAGDCGLFWAMTAYCGLFRVTVGYCELLWTIPGYCGLLWAIVGDGTHADVNRIDVGAPQHHLVDCVDGVPVRGPMQGGPPVLRGGDACARGWDA